MAGDTWQSVAVERVASPTAWQQHMRVRCAVFIDEQRVPPHEEVDHHDGLGALHAVPPSALHFLATVDRQPAGAGRCVIKSEGTAKVGRIATLPQFRRKGVGRAIMHCIHEHAARHGCVKSTLGAQLEAVPFYERLGYTVTSGVVFLDAGIEHVDMHCELTP
ncbi:hypothetical protein CLOM_g10337 [Closterium sp. NIES-68]|nr:hypothetical protein CLOM_g10337 [Closterium sp. NIES-68]GJP80621.1 hypothetical protein CLOP_g10822 [Closterium sp. NIES-67]